MKRRILTVTIWVFSILLFFSILWIVVINYGKNSCREIQISIEAPKGAAFINVEDVRNYITLLDDSVVGTELRKINIEKIENIINQNPFVFKSKVYITPGGIVRIEIKQRTPIVRVQNMFDQSYYICDDGYLMPVVEGKTSRLLFANGFITDLYMNALRLDIDSTKTEKDTISLNKNLVKLYHVARYINKDPFWKAQIQQLYLDKAGRILMMPLVGDQIIILGDSHFIAEKFEKLRIFNRKPEFLSSWDKYDTININFKDQIVCSKKIILKTK